MDEETAIQRLKSGDIGGLEFLVRRYQVKAVRTAYLVTQDPALAEDVVQDCFLQVFRSIHGFDEGRPFKPWFLTCVLHQAVKVAKKADRQVAFIPDTDQPWLDELLGRTDSAEDEAETTALQAEIWDAIGRLSPRQRQVVVQRYFLEMSEKEMAAFNRAAPGTVKWLLNAARSRLRSMLSGRKSA